MNETTDRATPRPWASTAFAIHPSHEVATIACVWGEYQDVIPGIRQIMNDEAFANAALIVRAVNAHDNLVEACELALEYLNKTDATHDSTGRRVDFSAVPAAIQAALAKVRQ